MTAQGLPLEAVLETLTSSTAGLSVDADADQGTRLRETVDRLTAVATKADSRRQGLLRSTRQDPLTGLANRGHLLDTGRAALAVGGAVLFVDVDRFWQVNDRGGHAVGDQLLVRLADRLRRHVEKELPGAVVGRLGGDEFVAVLPRIARITDVAASGRLSFSAMPRLSLSDDVVRRKQIHDGDILFARSGSVGKVAFVKDVTDPCIPGAYFIHLRVKSGTEAEFVAGFLRSDPVQRHIQRHAGRAAQPNLSGPALRQLPVPSVSREARRSFIRDARILDDVIDFQDEQTGLLSTLRDAALNRAMVGLK